MEENTNTQQDNHAQSEYIEGVYPTVYPLCNSTDPMLPSLDRYIELQFKTALNDMHE